MKSPALAGAGRFRGYGLTPPRPCQGRPRCQLSGRSSCLCEGLQARSNWLTTGCPSRPGQIPLWASATPLGPKHLESKPSGRCRGEAGGFTELGLPLRISFPGLVSGPLKPDSPETLARGASTPAGHVKPRLGGVCRFYTLNLNGAQVRRSLEDRFPRLSRTRIVRISDQNISSG